MDKNIIMHIVSACLFLMFATSCSPMQSKENKLLEDRIISYHISHHSQHNLILMLTYHNVSDTESFDVISIFETGNMIITRGVTGVFSHQTVSGMLMPDEKEKSIDIASSIQNLQAYNTNVKKDYFITVSLGDRNNFFVKSFNNEAAATKDICIIFDIVSSLYQREGRSFPPQCPLQ